MLIGEIDDIPAQMHPFLQYTRSRLPDVPLWNPHIMLGRPYVGNGQSAVFSPFNAPAYVLPFWRSLALIAALIAVAAASPAGSGSNGGRTVGCGSRPSRCSAVFIRLCMSTHGSA